MKRPQRALSAAASPDGDELFEFSGTITDYWTYTQVRDYVMLMPGMTHVAYRLYSLLRSMVVEASRRPRSGMRRMTIDQLCWLLPGPNDKSLSVSAMYEVLKTLERLELVVPKDVLELDGITALKGKERAAKGISRGFTVNDLPPAAEYDGWRNAWDKLDAYHPDWRETPPQPPTHLTTTETAANGQTQARVRLVDADGEPFQKTGTPQVSGDEGPSFQKTGQPFQKTGSPVQNPGTDSPSDLRKGSPSKKSLEEDSPSLFPGAPAEPSDAAGQETGGEESAASPDKSPPSPAAAQTGADEVLVAEAWISAREAHGHGVPARAGVAMARDAARLLADGVSVEYLVAAAADMGSRKTWFDLDRHLERFVMPAATVPGQRPALPAWCGKCNDGIEPTQPGQRMREDDGGRLVRCECHPSYGKSPALN
ncbi:hypothetical protein [Streptomyces sp. NPDC020983]|uniref:hypothetical protein n=1 Tax=Streptomyces sp. NPDC020983 TaxID=3365106 RepID=UPI0037BD3692